MPLAWAHAEFVKLLMSRQINRPFDRPRAMWQRYRARRPVATHAFWWPHAPIGAMRAGAKLAVALPFPSVVRWGRDGWQRIDETASIDSNLGVPCRGARHRGAAARQPGQFYLAAAGQWRMGRARYYGHGSRPRSGRAGRADLGSPQPGPMA